MWSIYRNGMLQKTALLLRADPRPPLFSSTNSVTWLMSVTAQVLDTWRVVLGPPRLSVGRNCKRLWRWHVLLQAGICPWDPRGMKQSRKNGTQVITFIQTDWRRDARRSGEINPHTDLSFSQSHQEVTTCKLTTACCWSPLFSLLGELSRHHPLTTTSQGANSHWQ